MLASALACAILGATAASGRPFFGAHHPAHARAAHGNPHNGGGGPGNSGGGPGKSGGGPGNAGGAGPGNSGHGNGHGGGPPAGHGGGSGHGGGHGNSHGHGGSTHTHGGGNPHAAGGHGNPHASGHGGNPHSTGTSSTPAAGGGKQHGHRTGTTGTSTGTSTPSAPTRPGNSRGNGLGGVITPVTPATPASTATSAPTPTATTPALSVSAPSLGNRAHRSSPVRTPLGLALGLTPGAGAAAGGGATLFTVPLLPGLGPAATITTAGAGNVDGPGSGHGKTVTGKASSVIQRIVDVIPGFIWIAIAISLALAMLGAAAAYRSRRRVRLQAGEFAAVSAAALTDSLTGVLNRRGFIDAVERELARAKRYDRPFVLAYVDVRGLKGVNDTEGHLAGDKLLKDAAQLLHDSARADDVVGRIGGDEMGLLLVEQGAEGAAAVINRISSQVPARREALGLRSSWDLTIGTAAYPEDGESVNDLLAAADRRLYEQRGIALS